MTWLCRKIDFQLTLVKHSKTSLNINASAVPVSGSEALPNAFERRLQRPIDSRLSLRTSPGRSQGTLTKKYTFVTCAGVALNCCVLV
eukprot:5656699-Amphidinium_carterae.2